MTPDQFDNNNNNNEKVREITQDRRNVSANMGRKQEPASLSFEFDNRPADPEGFNFDFDNKPVTPVQDTAPEAVPAEEPAHEKGPEETPAPEKSSEEEPVPEKAQEEETASEANASVEKTPEAPKKQYGLPEDYSRPQEPKPLQTAAPQGQSEFSKKLGSAKTALKKKIAAQQDARRAARAAEAERQRLLAREEEIRKAEAARQEELRKAEEARLAEEAAKRAEEARHKAEHEAKLEAAILAEMEAAKGKKAVKPAKTVKKGASGKVRPESKSLKEKKAVVNKKAAAKKEAEEKAAKQAADAAKPSGKKKGGKKKKKVKKKKGFFGWLLAIIEIMIALGIVGGIAGGAYAAITIAHADTIHPEQIYNTLEVSTHIYDDKGNLTDDIYLSENREIAKYEELPENLKNAFIAIEDKTFWTHKGFNFKRIFGAIWNSVSGGGEISGTSTITQQLARNIFLPEEKSVRSIKRKIIEMYYAHEIEETLSKEEILAAYLNTIYLGYGCYGVDTAAKKYFGTDVEDLTLEECAALASLPQAPGVYELLMTEDDEAETTTKVEKGLYANDISRDRRYLVLDLMAEQGYITQEEADAAKKPLEEFINPGGASMSSSSSFKDYLLDTVKHDLMEQYDLSDEQAEKLIYTKGLNIYSTLDSQAQKIITKEFKKKENFPSAVRDDAKVEGAMVIVKVGTGEIKAMAGTRRVNGEKLFNRAVSPRQPGSSIKPIAVYAPALQKSYEYQKDGKLFKFKNTGYDNQGTRFWGNYITASSGVTDEVMKVNGKTWPKNFSRSYSGYKTFRQAIQQSINTCAVKILAQIGTDYSMEMVKKFGISTAIDDTSEAYNDVNLAALGLGAMTEGVTPLDMALAYAVFPNGGVYNSGICYTKVTDSDGKILLEGKSEESRVLNKGVAYIMTDVLQSVVSDGIAYDAAISGEKVGGKTGTTDETWDIWFDGFTPKYAAALWIGTDNNVELNTTSATAAKLWSRIMSQVKRAKGGEYKSRPDNVIVKNGEYYTNGTQPPDPPPEEKKDKDKDKDKAKDAKDDAKQAAPNANPESDKKDKKN
ncbi:MAG: transglycosylase domain-containing protein [Mogibacterium sp.]|nr:transglycosylase domain-containing protein [Mogibacterium sp.]